MSTRTMTESLREMFPHFDEDDVTEIITMAHNSLAGLTPLEMATIIDYWMSYLAEKQGNERQDTTAKEGVEGSS